MSYRLELDRDRRLFVGFNWGALVVDELVAGFAPFADEDAALRDCDEIVLVHSMLDLSDLSPDRLREVLEAEARVFGVEGESTPTTKTAFVCVNAELHPSLRLYGAYVRLDDSHNAEVQVFSNLGRALKWLGRYCEEFERELLVRAESVMGGL